VKEKIKMAVNNIAKFNWEKILSKVDDVHAKRSLNLLRSKANEITAASAKFGSAPEKINFAAYKQKLRFTTAAVDALEAAYSKKSLPTYTATLPDFDAQKRAATLAVVDQIVESSKADLVNLAAILVEAEANSINTNTSYGDLCNRFPQLAREVEQEIKNGEWSK
jgi:hypothetical protein